MNSRKQSRLRSILLGCMVIAMVLGMSAGSGRTDAQVSSRRQVEKRLSLAVSLPDGSLTLSALAAALSKQTGIRIQADTALQENIIVAQWNKMSAMAALDSLVELNDWRWQITEQGTVIIARKRVSPPKDIIGLPDAMRAALPEDSRHYFLGFSAPQQRQTVSDSPPAQVLASDAIPAKFAQAVENRKRGLFSALQPTIFNGKPLLYTQLTPQQQNVLVAVLVQQAFAHSDPHTLQLMQGAMPLSLFETPALELTLRETFFLVIGRTTRETLDGQQADHFRGVGGGRVLDLHPQSKEAKQPPQ